MAKTSFMNCVANLLYTIGISLAHRDTSARDLGLMRNPSLTQAHCTAATKPSRMPLGRTLCYDSGPHELTHQMLVYYLIHLYALCVNIYIYNANMMK